MKKFIFILVLLSLLFVAFSVANSCGDGIDNDGDDLVDLDDVGCLDSSDASERDYGYQIESAEDVDEDCLDYLVDSDVSCVESHYEELSWLVAFLNPETFTSCLAEHYSEYYYLVYDSEKEYTKIAVADCVYDHYSDFVNEVSSAASKVTDLESICLEAYYDDYSSVCVATKLTCGDSTEFNVGEISTYSGHDITLNSVPSNDYAIVDVDGVTMSIMEGTTEVVEGLSITVDSLFYRTESDESLAYLTVECVADIVDICGGCDIDSACVTNSSYEYYGECKKCEDFDGDMNDFDVTTGSVVQGVLFYNGSYVSYGDECNSSVMIAEYACVEIDGNSYVTRNIINCEDEKGEGYECYSDSITGMASCMKFNYECDSDEDCTNGEFCDLLNRNCMSNDCNDLCYSDVDYDGSGGGYVTGIDEDCNCGTGYANNIDDYCEDNSDCVAGVCDETYSECFEEEEDSGSVALQCADGLDNDEDGDIDFLGVCSDVETSCLDEGLSSRVLCKKYCEKNSGSFTVHDQGCSSLTDDDESSSTGSPMAAGELEESIFMKFLGWLMFWE